MRTGYGQQSFYRLRRTLGGIGFSLPFLLLIGSALPSVGMQDTISAYYFTPMRDVLVGTLVALGLFLLTYQGYAKAPEQRFSDDLVTTVAGAAIIGVAVFPTLPNDIEAAVRLSQEAVEMPFAAKASALLHVICAGTFFLVTGYLSYFHFYKTTGRGRAVRFRAYGLAIWLALGFMGASFAAGWASSSFAELVLGGLNLLFWLEAVAVWLFSIAWLDKGRFLQNVPTE